MKLLFSIIIVALSFATIAKIPEGKYQVEKIQCNSGKVFKLGGKHMIYDIYLTVTPTIMRMTANSKSNMRNLPLNITCTQINEGSYVYTQDNVYEGELKSVKSQCNNVMWTTILKLKKFGVESYGVFNYQVAGNKLVIYNTKTTTKYSCDGAGDYPIIHYKKI